MTGRVCLVLVVKKLQWYGEGYCSFVSIKDPCPCQNLSCAVHRTCVSLVAAGWEVKMWFVNRAAAWQRIVACWHDGH